MQDNKQDNNVCKNYPVYWGIFLQQSLRAEVHCRDVDVSSSGRFFSNDCRGRWDKGPLPIVKVFQAYLTTLAFTLILRFFFEVPTLVLGLDATGHGGNFFLLEV